MPKLAFLKINPIIIFCITICLAMGLSTHAQTPDSVWLEIQSNPSILPANAQRQWEKTAKGKMPLFYWQKEMGKLMQSLHQEGYIAANIDSSSCKDSLCIAYLSIGKSYQWAHLKNGNVSLDLLEVIGFKERFYEQRPFHYKELARLQNKLLTYCENNGYPFAQFWLDSIRIEEAEASNTIAARIFVDLGPIITLEKLEVVGKTVNDQESSVRISTKYLTQYLGLKEGSLYDESQLKKIKKRLRELPFLAMYRDPHIIFIDQSAQPKLFLENRRASRFDVLFGLLPSNNAVTGQQQLNFTGNVHIDLFNPFGTGKRIIAKWQQYQKGRSEMSFAFWYPYLINTPLGLDLKFDIYRRDSTYVDVISDIGVQYLFDGNNYLKLFWKNSTTNVQTIDTQRVLTTRKLPSILDLRNSTLGLEYYFQRLDYRWNPTNGFELKTIVGVGIKRVRPNNAILNLQDRNDPTFDFASLYDSLGQRSFQYSYTVDYAHFIPLWKQSCIMGRARSGAIFSSNQKVYRNELYRIGGSKTMRGFDEQSIFASWYNIASIEWRYILGTNSYAYLFGDLGYVQDKSIDENKITQPYGFGVGIALETKVGIFGLTYALGSNVGLPLLVRNAKIHFGYVNIF